MVPEPALQEQTREARGRGESAGAKHEEPISEEDPRAGIDQGWQAEPSRVLQPPLLVQHQAGPRRLDATGLQDERNPLEPGIQDGERRHENGHEHQPSLQDRDELGSGREIEFEPRGGSGTSQAACPTRRGRFQEQFGSSSEYARLPQADQGKRRSQRCPVSGSEEHRKHGR